MIKGIIDNKVGISHIKCNMNKSLANRYNGHQ